MNDRSYNELSEIFKSWLKSQQPKVSSGDRNDTVVKINASTRRIPSGQATPNSRTHTNRSH